MVGKKIRAFREFRGYSQIQLAELSGINNICDSILAQK